MPESLLDARVAAVRRGLRRIQRGYRLRALVDALIIGSAATGLVYGVALATSDAESSVVVAALVTGFATFAGATIYGWRSWTLARTARAAERRWPQLENLVVTAAEALAGHRIHPVLAGDLYAHAAARLESVDSSSWKSSITAAVLAVVILSVTALLMVRGSDRVRAQPPGAVAVESVPSAPAAMLRAMVIPPSYSRRLAKTIDNPVQLEVLEGSRVRIEVDGAPQPDFVATASRVLLVPTGETERLLQVLVEPDNRPRVTIEQPGRDLVFGAPRGSVAVRINAQDDLAVASVALRYTRIAGSGETFTFEEGELPLQFAQAADPARRHASGTFVLDQLTLEDGDTLVYRAVARDDKPGADPSVSESFLIEIGRRGTASAGGFALPEDRDRHALSQQMLIMKTERLHANRGKLAAEAVVEQSRLLAVEQRMIRAEFLFMTGGEVVDEVEEAEHSDELAQGRFENPGQVELLNAIREMSRAEARLNAGDTAQALVVERGALQALQRAFDRRRYFLRTLPARARIDLSRRFSGDMSTARSTTRSPVAREMDPEAARIRSVMRDLTEAARARSGLDARLAARILALDPRSIELQRAAIRLSAGDGVDESLAAARSAQVHFVSLLHARLARSAAARVPRDPLLGALADQLLTSRARR